MAVQKDFYRLTESFPDDIKWVRSLGFTEKGPDGLREFNEGWIRLFEIFWSAQDLRHHVPEFVDLITELDRQLIERQEDYYCLMETTAVQDMEAMKRGDVSFFLEDHRAVAFCFFLMNQYFRTKKLHDHMRKQFDSDGQAARFDRVWPILREIFSTNTAFGVFANRESAPLRVVSAPHGLKFITGDQPIINTYAAFIDEATPVDDLELYFPVSPTHAAIISSHHAYQNTHGKELDAFRVNYLNQAMELQAHDQLFASTKEELQILASTFK